MLKNNKKRKAYSKQIFLLLLFLSVQLTMVNALSFDTPYVVVANNGEDVSFILKISNNVSEVNIIKNVSEGHIGFDGSNHYYSWLTNYDSRNYLKVTFTASDNESSVSSSTIIANPPLITGLENKNINSDTFNIELETSIYSVCKYGLSEKSFSGLDYAFKNVDGKKHEGQTPTLNQGSHTIYVICQTPIGAESKASFFLNVNLYPSAEIRLSPSSPLRAGIISVEVVASEDLISAPELKYYFDDDSSPKSITLTGSGNRWSGFMVIHESDKRRIGTFLFKGTDKTNLEGTDITKGKIFIVDNYVPSSVSSFEAKVLSEGIRLEWKYLDDEFDEIVEYRIYRKTSRGGVDYINYLTTTSNNYYFDHDVVFEEAYYYKVSAVNHASKEGPLSREIPVTFVPSRTEESTSEGLAPDLRTELKNKISFVDALILDVDLAESRIQRLSSNDELLIVQELELLASIVASRNKLKNVVSELSKLESRSLSSSDFDKAVSNLISEANLIWDGVPVGLEIKDSVFYEEVVDFSLASDVFEKYLVSENFNLSRKEASELLIELVNSQSSFMVESTIISALVNYPSKEKTVSFVVKEISFPEVMGEAIILDNVVSFNIGDVVFVERPLIVGDYLAKWSVKDVSSKRVVYYSFEDSSFDIFRESRVFVFSQTKVQDAKNLITAMVAKDVERSSSSLFVPLIIGLLSILVLSVYYFKSDEFVLPSVVSFRKIFDVNLFSKKDDSHKKLDLEKPPELDVSARSVDDFVVDKVVNVEDVHKTVVEESLDENTSSTQSTSLKVAEKESVSGVDSQVINEDVLTTLHDLKNKVEKIYHSEDSFDDDFRYVSKIRSLRRQFSRPAPKGKEFLLCDGRILKNLNDLKGALKHMDDGVFYHHVSLQKNDFYAWVRDVFGYKSLASRIRNVKSKDELFKKLKF